MSDEYGFTLRHGRGSNPDEGCLWQRAAIMHAERHGYLDQVPIEAIMTDRPCWANKTLNFIGMVCNDYLDDEERQRLRPLLERCLLATVKEDDVERRINARILCHQARKVLDIITDPELRDKCDEAISAREAWLRGEITEEECMLVAKKISLLNCMGLRLEEFDRYASDAARNAAECDPDGAGISVVAMFVGKGTQDWVEFLEEALDVWEKACAEEGALADEREAERRVAEFVQANGG